MCRIGFACRPGPTAIGVIIGLGALGCDGAPQGGRSARVDRDPIDSAPQSSTAPAAPDAARLPPSIADAELEALRAEVRRALRDELRAEVIAELRRELTPEVKKDLLAELRPHATADAADSAQGSSAQAALDAGPDLGAEPDPRPPATESSDIWSTPGTKIWPSSGGLKLVELVVGTALEDKLPTDVRTHYPNTPEILYCYTVFENPLPDQTVTHVWRRGSRLVSRVELEVGRSPKWRTWSKQRTQPHWTGLWSCEVLGENGEQLGLTVFQIGG